jgi:hypothetical protein
MESKKQSTNSFRDLPPGPVILNYGSADTDIDPVSKDIKILTILLKIHKKV